MVSSDSLYRETGRLQSGERAIHRYGPPPRFRIPGLCQAGLRAGSPVLSSDTRLVIVPRPRDQPGRDGLVEPLFDAKHKGDFHSAIVLSTANLVSIASLVKFDFHKVGIECFYFQSARRTTETGRPDIVLKPFARRIGMVRWLNASRRLGLSPIAGCRCLRRWWRGADGPRGAYG